VHENPYVKLFSRAMARRASDFGLCMMAAGSRTSGNILYNVACCTGEYGSSGSSKWQLISIASAVGQLMFVEWIDGCHLQNPVSSFL